MCIILRIQIATASLWVATTLAATAQVVPATPKNFERRGIGGIGTGSSSTGIKPGSEANSKPIVRQISYLSLSEVRQWTNIKNQTLFGKLIAFEQIEVEVSGDGSPAPASAAAFPARPTVIKDGKIRLVVEQKTHELPLETLSEADRTFVSQLDQSIAQRASNLTPATRPVTEPKEP